MLCPSSQQLVQNTQQERQELHYSADSATGCLLTNDQIATPIVATARSFANGATVTNFVNGQSFKTFTSFNGQITNRVAFAFTAPATGIGSVLRIDTSRGFIGVITDFSGGVGVTSTFTADMIRNIGGAGAFGSGVGIGTTTLTIFA